MKPCYAVYKGDRFIDLGDLEYISTILGIKPKSVLFMLTPTYQKRIIGREDSRLIIIKLEEEKL